jgi:hypothetical protein
MITVHEFQPDNRPSFLTYSKVKWFSLACSLVLFWLTCNTTTPYIANWFLKIFSLIFFLGFIFLNFETVFAFKPANGQLKRPIKLIANGIVIDNQLIEFRNISAIKVDLNSYYGQYLWPSRYGGPAYSEGADNTFVITIKGQTIQKYFRIDSKDHLIQILSYLKSNELFNKMNVKYKGQTFRPLDFDLKTDTPFTIS